MSMDVLLFLQLLRWTYVKYAVFEDFSFPNCPRRAAVCVVRLKDYVTEKVYNGLQAGTLPVYWGAANIEDYVPGGSVVKVILSGKRRNWRLSLSTFGFLFTMP